MREPLTVQANKPYQLYVARLDNTGNVNLTIKIKTNVTFISDGTTLQNPNFTKINFLGEKEYTREPVEYPFFLVPLDQVQVWLNVTLTEPGNYTFTFETDSKPQLPEGVTTPISVTNGKFNAKLIAESPVPFTLFGLSLTHVVAFGAGSVLLTLVVAYTLMRVSHNHHIRKMGQTVKPEMLSGGRKRSRKEYIRKYMQEKRRKQRKAKS